MGHGTSTVPCIDEGSQFFMLLGFRPKDGIDLVIEDGRRSVRMRHLPE
jgi:hypothetical protein